MREKLVKLLSDSKQTRDYCFNLWPLKAVIGLGANNNNWSNVFIKAVSQAAIKANQE